jgi:hypothetical protein
MPSGRVAVVTEDPGASEVFVKYVDDMDSDGAVFLKEFIVKHCEEIQ